MLRYICQCFLVSSIVVPAEVLTSRPEWCLYFGAMVVSGCHPVIALRTFTALVGINIAAVVVMLIL